MYYKHRPINRFEGLDATLITIIGLTILLVFSVASPPLSSAGGNAAGKIAFVRGSGTAQEIYVMNADGSAQTRVTNNAVEDYFPVISPNGAKIAFESVRNGNRDIYVIDPDGTNEQRLTTVPGVDLHPAWSPNGNQIAFSSEQNGNRDIYVMSANGSNQRRVTTDPGSDLHPVYSLDGTRLAFASERDGDREIYAIGSGGTEGEFNVPLRLTDNISFDSFPAWSPDGTKIVFHSFRDGNFEIYVMDVDGENQTNLTRSSTEDIFPNWSPDGTKIVFESLRGGNRDIYVMEANGNNPTRLTTDAAPDLIPSWHWERPATGSVRTISGRVVNISGGAVGDLTIDVRRRFDGAATPPCVTSNASVKTSTDGTYSIQVTTGCTYRVEPNAQELQRLFGQNGISLPTFSEVFVAFNVPDVNFAAGLIPTPNITGRIIDGSRCPNYNPAQDANLECGLPGVTVTGEWTGETRTDVSRPISSDPSNSGKYTLPSFLTNSVVRVRAFLPGYVITIIPPNTEQITLTSATRPLVDFRALRANSTPAVSLTDPANGTTYPPAPQIIINANASDSDGAVSKVEFFQNNTKLGEDSTGPYSFTWNTVASGSYFLTAIATDNGGASTTSDAVSITVNAPPTPTPTPRPAINPLEGRDFFVNQHYRDFLDRDADPGGLAYWSDQLAACGSDATCYRKRRIGVSAAFFVELEFQRTGSFVYRLFKGGLARRPTYPEFNTDRAQVREGATLEADKQALTLAHVQRNEFVQKYAGQTTATTFVDALIASIQQASSLNIANQRAPLISKYNTGGNMNESRALVLRDAIESTAFLDKEYNAAFVLMQYFGYLRRDPDQAGYDFWLGIVNNPSLSNYRSMVCAFLTSGEYQLRFSDHVPRRDTECADIN